MFRLALLAVALCRVGFGQTAALSLSPGSGSPGGTVTLSLSLNATVTSPAALQWTLNYSTTDFSAITVTAGSAATAAGKSISCNSTAGTPTCVVWGLNSTPISNGVVATVSLTISNSTKDTSSLVQVNASGAASAAGIAITSSATGATVIINQISPPTAVSVTPNTGSGTSHTFTFQYSSANGYGYLNTVYALINNGLEAGGGCFTYYLPAGNGIYLSNNADTSVTGPLTPGSSGTLSNSQCTINGTGSSATGSGNTLSLTLSVSFTGSFTGAKQLYGYAVDNGGQQSGWQQLGTWTTGAISPPSAVSVSPNSGSGASHTFTFQYSSTNGFGYLNTVYVLINNGLEANGGCFLYYVPGSNGIYLFNNADTSITGPLTPGSSGTLSNSQCTINGTGSSATGAGNILSLTLSVAFAPSFLGKQMLYGYAVDNLGQPSGWQQLGTWTTGAIPPPTAVSVTPNTGTGTSQNFTFQYSSTNGFGYLNTVYVLINNGLDANGGCFLYYVPGSNGIYLFNNADTSVTGPLTPGSSGTLSNSQCTINGTGSSASGAGNTLSLTLSVSFTGSFLGTQTVYGYAVDNGGQPSGWQPLGTWNTN